MSNELKIKTVMTIDDDELDQMLYKRVIDRSGIVDNVISFQLAEEALTYLKSEDRAEIDVIFLDINMPRMNGFEFLEQALNELGPEFSKSVVIMLTTSLNPADKERADKHKVVKAFLHKPLTIEQLQTTARSLL